MTIEAVFVKSAAAAADIPRDGFPEIALVGRSNVGKSSLINALVRRKIARTSRTPGKTQLANVYRVARGSAAPVFFVDLPGYGYARGGASLADDLRAVTQAFFSRVGQGPQIGALLLVDARHPGLDSDIEAWHWLSTLVDGRTAIVATKIDKLTRGERIRALGQLESVFEHPVLACSAVTGEGLEDLWKLIDRLAKSPRPSRHSSRLPSPPPREPTAPRPRKNSSASTSRR